MEDSKLNPEENNPIETSPNLNLDNKDLNEGNKKEENVKAFTEFLEKASNQDSSEEKVKPDSEQQKPKIDKSLFKRFLNNGFDGISTNPNYKMLALLIILLKINYFIFIEFSLNKVSLNLVLSPIFFFLKRLILLGSFLILLSSILLVQ